MPRRKFIDKKTATTFDLVYRSQDDPLIHDASASSMVFAERGAAPQGRKIKTRSDLDSEFGGSVRDNEGEAANHGVFFDDTEYDYMQHLRDLGEGGVWVEGSEAGDSVASRRTGKGKGKMKLEDALAAATLDAQDGGVSLADSTTSTSTDARSLFDERMLPGEFVQQHSYQNMQEVPDEIAGFQPDMDPRLREVLEALEDEAYVDDEEEIFEQLTGNGAELMDRDDWEAEGQWEDDDDQGWESDRTITPTKPKSKLIPSPPSEETEDAASSGPVSSDLPPPPTDAPIPDAPEASSDGAWLAEFSKFKKDAKVSRIAPHLQPSVLTSQSSLASGRHKKRKGALTSSTGYSMTSSSLVRTQQQTLLDARFDKIAEDYENDILDNDFDESASMASGLSGLSGLSKTSGMSKMSRVSGVSATESEAPQLRHDFDGIMDEFLGGYSMQGKRRVKKGGHQSGLEQLDEIRKGLGPARIRSQKA